MKVFRRKSKIYSTKRFFFILLILMIFLVTFFQLSTQIFISVKIFKFLNCYNLIFLNFKLYHLSLSARENVITILSLAISVARHRYEQFTLFVFKLFNKFKIKQISVN